MPSPFHPFRVYLVITSIGTVIIIISFIITIVSVIIVVAIFLNVVYCLVLHL